MQGDLLMVPLKTQLSGYSEERFFCKTEAGYYMPLPITLYMTEDEASRLKIPLTKGNLTNE